MGLKYITLLTIKLYSQIDVRVIEIMSEYRDGSETSILKKAKQELKLE